MTTTTLTQAEAVLALLRLRPAGITPMTAINELGCMRLAARIKELRDAGHDIATVSETRNGRTYARYVYSHPAEDWWSEAEQRAMWGDR